MNIEFVNAIATCEECKKFDEHPSECVRCGECGREFDENGAITNFRKFPSFYPMPSSERRKMIDEYFDSYDEYFDEKIEL